MRLTSIMALSSVAILTACGGGDSNSGDKTTGGATVDTRADWATAAFRPGGRGDGTVTDSGVELGGEHFVVRQGTLREDVIRLYPVLAEETAEAGLVWSNDFSNTSAYYRPVVGAATPVDGESNTGRFDGVAVAGFYHGDRDASFAGFAGTTSGAPTTGTVNYDGVYHIATADALTTIDTNIAVNADAGTLISNKDGLVVAGTLNGNDIGGNVTYSGEIAPLDGGFFGDELLGVFLGTTYAGTMYGSQQ